METDRLSEGFPADEIKLDIGKPHVIQDVKCVIDHDAMHNYLAQLGRRELFGLSVFAIKICDIEVLHASLTNENFITVIKDVATSCTLKMTMCRHLICYTGGGIFVLICGDSKKLNVEETLNSIAGNIGELSTYNPDDEPIDLTFMAGKVIKMTSVFGKNPSRLVQRATESVKLRELSRHADRASVPSTVQTLRQNRLTLLAVV